MKGIYQFLIVVGICCAILVGLAKTAGRKRR